MKNVLYFTEKASMFLEIFRFLYFSQPFFFPLSVIVEFIGDADRR